jgi:hypothetical protein
MLASHARGTQDSLDNEGIIYKGISAVDAEALQLALIELGRKASDSIGEIRENKHGCCGRGP